MKISNNKQVNLRKLDELKLPSQEEKKELAKVEEKKQPEKQVDSQKAENLKEGTSKLENFLKQEEVSSAPRRIFINKDKKEEEKEDEEQKEQQEEKQTPMIVRNNLNAAKPKVNKIKTINTAKINKSETLNIADKMREKMNSEGGGESEIRDADMAQEMATYTKDNILQKGISYKYDSEGRIIEKIEYKDGCKITSKYTYEVTHPTLSLLGSDTNEPVFYKVDVLSENLTTGVREAYAEWYRMDDDSFCCRQNYVVVVKTTESEKPDIPDEPEVPDVPDEPEIPEEPEVPDEPKVGTKWDEPDGPPIGEVLDKEPDVPEVPDEPEIPDTPDVPDIPDDIKITITPDDILQNIPDIGWGECVLGDRPQYGDISEEDFINKVLDRCMNDDHDLISRTQKIIKKILQAYGIEFSFSDTKNYYYEEIKEIYTTSLYNAIRDAIINNLDDTYRTWSEDRNEYYTITLKESEEMQELFKQNLAELLSKFLSKLYPDGYPDGKDSKNV